jgi:uncharacterized protein YkwD
VSPHGRRTPPRFRPQVEALEARELPAGFITRDPLTQVVTVRGTPRNDRLVIAARGGRVTVQLSGGAQQVRQFARGRVGEVLFLPNGGADQLINRTAIVSLSFDPARAASPSDVLPQINALRQAQKLPALAVSPLLQQAAQAHADNMARRDRYGDTDTNGHILDGHDFYYRAAAVGYRGQALGEIVAYNFGYAEPVRVLLVQWTTSPTHRAQMLSAAYTEAGVGVAVGASGRTYGVVLFGRPA